MSKKAIERFFSLLEKKEKDILSKVDESLKPALKRVFASKRRIKNPMSAIKANCLECTGGDRQEIKDCTYETCPFYLFRLGKNPFRNGGLEAKKATAKKKKPSGKKKMNPGLIAMQKINAERKKKGNK